MAKQKFPPCPKCGKKGLHYASHAHAQGWKDYDKAECRFCGSRFKVSEPNTACTGLAPAGAQESEGSTGASQ